MSIDSFCGNYLYILQALSIVVSIVVCSQHVSYLDWLKLADPSISELLRCVETAELQPISICFSESSSFFQEILGISSNDDFTLSTLPISSLSCLPNNDTQSVNQRLVSVLGKISYLCSRENHVLLEGMFSCPKCKVQQRKSFFKDIYHVSLFQIYQLLTESKVDKLTSSCWKNVDPLFFSQIESIKSAWKSISKCETPSCKTALDSMYIDWKSPENRLFSYYYAR